MKTASKKAPAALVRTLLLAARPGARVLLVGGKAFILNGKEHTYISDRTYDALIEREWMTRPRQIEGDLAPCSITVAGYAAATAIDGQHRKYRQLELRFESSVA